MLQKLYRHFYQKVTAHDVLNQQLFDAQIHLAQHAAAAEYHQAMTEMLHKRIRRLNESLPETHT